MGGQEDCAVMRLRHLGAVLSLAALGACASAGPTPYQPRTPEARFGWSEQKVEANRLRITFEGNSLTNRETVELYMLNRAAEATLGAGYDWFVAADRDIDATVRRTPIGPSRLGPYAGFGVGYSFFHPRWGWRGWYDPFWDNHDVIETTRYSATVEIVMMRGGKPADRPDAFDAREVQANLAGRIVRPAPAP
jgi:hypothetical protein